MDHRAQRATGDPVVEEIQDRVEDGLLVAEEEGWSSPSSSTYAAPGMWSAAEPRMRRQ
ncbi:MAG: hypothetical protein ACRD29_09550 [Acidimicrobiales bacterium]